MGEGLKEKDRRVESGERVGVVSEASRKVTLVAEHLCNNQLYFLSHFEYQLLLSTVSWRHKCSTLHFTSSDELDGRDCVIFVPPRAHRFMAQLY